MAEPELTKAQAKWIEEQQTLMDEGNQLIGAASDEALEYVRDAIEHLNDPAWRKMAMATQAVEMGIGQGFAEHLVPRIYNDMEKHFLKVGKLNKQTALALKHIYIGRVIKNVRKALNERDQ